MNILFAARTKAWVEYEPELRRALQQAGLTATLERDLPPEDVDYIIYAPNSTLQDFTPYTRCRGVLNLWAGVEAVVHNSTLTQPLVRMVDDGLTLGMVEWVTGHVLRHHLGMDQHIVNPDKVWDDTPPPLAKDREVCILGLGALGAACATALHSLGFRVSGWARTAKNIDGVTAYHGRDGLGSALAQADIAVLLLPLTPDTTGVINARTLAAMKPGAVIINPGRGPLIVDEDLIEALDAGHIQHATLDVFHVEPLPQDHPYWSHPRVTVTPHIASATRSDTASDAVVQNILRLEAGDTALGLVDRARAY